MLILLVLVVKVAPSSFGRVERGFHFVENSNVRSQFKDEADVHAALLVNLAGNDDVVVVRC